MMLGRVDEIDGHFIATRFVAMIVPAECLYVSSNARASRPTLSGAGGGPVSTKNALAIRFDWKSVGIAYARVWLPLVAAALPLTQLAAGTSSPGPWIVSAILIGASVAARGAGRLSEPEKARLRLLGTVTGLRIDPAKLKETTRTVKRDSLGDLMDKAGIPLTAAEIVSVLDDIPLPALPLVYGFARYAGDDREWHACAEAVYVRHEAGEI